MLNCLNNKLRVACVPGAMRYTECYIRMVPRTIIAGRAWNEIGVWARPVGVRLAKCAFLGRFKKKKKWLHPPYVRPCAIELERKHIFKKKKTPYSNHYYYLFCFFFLISTITRNMSV